MGGIEKILRRTIREDIDLQTRLDSSKGLVRADVSQVEQILVNLAVNSQDSIPDVGDITIEILDVVLDEQEVNRFPGARPGPYLMLIFTDTGVGMDEDTQKQVFEPFFTTKALGEASGLGLAMVHGIMEQHGGSVCVESEPGRGTSFKILFPCVEAVAGNSRAMAPGEEELGGGETVVVVEDNEMVRELVSLVLIEHGYHVLVAELAEECRRLLEEHDGPVDLLLTDIVLPRMNGKELYQVLASKMPDLKVLYMSGYPKDVIACHGILERGITFLQKPMSIQELTRKVRAALDVGKTLPNHK